MTRHGSLLTFWRFTNRIIIIIIMHDGMPCDSIQGQGQGHGVCEVPKIALFQLHLLRHLQWQLASDY